MSPYNSDDEDILKAPLPPKICSNPRAMIQPQQIDPRNLTLPLTTLEKRKVSEQVVLKKVQEAPLPCPKSPLVIIWSPDRLYFDLHEKPIVQKLWICNGSSRIIYIHCCGLWNDTARLGASWHTYPRTRFHLAPGMKTELCIKATPRIHSPTPGAVLCLQLAAAHKRDHVTGFFAVPIVAKFLTYLPPSLDDSEE